jgi:Tfp pilus assembly PilM family ATPase
MAFVEEVISSQELAGLAVSVADLTSFAQYFEF